MPKKNFDLIRDAFLDPVTRWMWARLGAKEFSLENVLAYWLIFQFKENPPSRLRARIIFEMFFKKGADFEVNCSRTECTAAEQAIMKEADESKKLSPEYARIFNQLLKAITINLSDTYSRLCLDPQYIAYTSRGTGDKLLDKIHDTLSQVESLDFHIGGALGLYKDLNREVVELGEDGKPVIIDYDEKGNEKVSKIKAWQAKEQQMDRRSRTFRDKFSGLKILNRLDKNRAKITLEYALTNTEIAGWKTVGTDEKGEMMRSWIPQLKKAGFDLTGLGIPKMLLLWGPTGK